MTLAKKFIPLKSVIFISENGIEEIFPENIEIDKVGEKAYGLACIPTPWTLPFIVISDALLTQYRKNPDLLEAWKTRIQDGLERVNINSTMDLIIRSSGCTEGLEERGKLYSCWGNFTEFFVHLQNCLENIIKDPELTEDKIPLIIQHYVQARSAKGHLSNERRCYKEHRDWLGEFEDEKLNTSEAFQINIRNWRVKINIDNYLNTKIECKLKDHLEDLLAIPATWATNENLRLHFEWVWDGNNIYIVQADQEKHVNGYDPTKVYENKKYVPLEFIPKCLTEINQEHTQKFKKIHNVFVYQKLDLPIAKLYILDNQTIIRQLANGESINELESDLKELTSTNLIIRMDIAVNNKEFQQMLPRKAVDNVIDAITWIREQSIIKLSEMADYEIAFIFHNFIPALSSAFVYAVPNERIVQIESLWGLPEGLYYNAHDKYIVDTKVPNENLLDPHKFSIDKRINYKHFFVIPDENGVWSSKRLVPPYDWKESINTDWIREIAYQSRRIAKAENKALSIMWFVDINKEIHDKQLFPWHHEDFDLKLTNRSKSQRKKTPFDKTFIIQTRSDIDQLHQEILKDTPTNIKRIRIQPSEENLLREKNTLKEIGVLAKQLDAVILLEGGILSHAYYQLMQTNAIVEIQHPFDYSDEKREFNKLVRDKVPNNIESGGELVNIVKLSGESLLKALKDKLVEEAFEVLDATNTDEILEELADVSEIIEGILAHLGIQKSELIEKQERKNIKAGGFLEGKVLLNTENPLPSEKIEISGALFDLNELGNTIKEVKYNDVIHNKIDRWDDKRTHQNVDETIMKLSIPVIRETWSADSSEISLDTIPSTKLKLKFTGTREGSKNSIEVSIYTQAKKQYSLFD